MIILINDDNKNINNYAENIIFFIRFLFIYMFFFKGVSLCLVEG